MDFVGHGALLRNWVSNFCVGKTNPYMQPHYMYPGIPRGYGSLAESLGQDTSYCRNTFIDTTKDCKKFDCALTDGGYENKPRCSDYISMLHHEKIKAEDKKLEQEAKKARMQARRGSQGNVAQTTQEDEPGPWSESEAQRLILEEEQIEHQARELEMEMFPPEENF